MMEELLKGKGQRMNVSKIKGMKLIDEETLLLPRWNPLVKVVKGCEAT